MSINFEIEESELISGVWIIRPSISNDIRGNIWTSFLRGEVEKLIPETASFKHDKFSMSKQNVLRGIHGDSKSYKLVTCVFGKIQQVVVDLRKDSPTFLSWQDFVISSDDQIMVLLPPNMGNAYYVCSKEAVYHYKLAYEGEYIDADQQFSVRWNDDTIGINWMGNSPILSVRDQG